MSQQDRLRGATTAVSDIRFDSYDVYAGRGIGNKHLLNTPIGEQGWLGNPYHVGDYELERSLELYEEDFEARLDTDERFREAVSELSGSILGCYCQRLGGDSPACHAEVIAAHADRLASADGENPRS